jgi:hypothetical protein
VIKRENNKSRDKLIISTMKLRTNVSRMSTSKILQKVLDMQPEGKQPRGTVNIKMGTRG